MLKIAKSTSGLSLNKETLESLKSAGFDAIEVSYPVEGYENINYEELKALSEQIGLELWSFHLPFTPFGIVDISNKEYVDETVELCKDYVDKGTAIGIKYYVIHPSAEPMTEDERADHMATAQKGLAILAEYAKTKGAVICVENLPRTCLGRDSSDILDLISAHPELRVCFDTNHLLAEDPVDFIHKLGKNIVTTHVSDYDLLNERHWLPGEGVTNWKALYNALIEVGYVGPWLYECEFGGSSQTINREKELTPEDFVNNAHEIFEGKELTVYGKGVEGLTSWKE